MIKYVAKYLRISQDDDNLGESSSIISQRQIIDNYISSVAEFTNIPTIEYIDDGYSGTNFDRPDMKKLLDAVKKGDICCIIVKDFSRFGRRYLEAGKLIDQIFPYLGVRFIAVNDQYDSNNHLGSTPEIDVPIKNMINAMYSKDISRKVKSAKQTKIKQGIFINAHTIYGYKKDTSDKHKIIIDEPAASVVQQIFRLAQNDYTPYQISIELNNQHIPSPAVYKKQNGCERGWNIINDNSILWTKATVLRLLHDERYTGIYIGGKWSVGKLGSKKQIRNPENEWTRIFDSHPAIITLELFNQVKEKISNKNAVKKGNNSDRFLYKKIQCGQCGHLMRYRDDVKNPFYYCDTARYSNHYNCCKKKIYKEELINVLKSAIQTQLKTFLNYEKLYYNKKRELQQNIKLNNITLKKLENEIKLLHTSKRQLYECYKKEKINKQTYTIEKEILENEINIKKSDYDKLVFPVEIKSDKFAFIQKFLCSFQNDPKIYDELIEKVLFYDENKIEIKYLFSLKESENYFGP